MTKKLHFWKKNTKNIFVLFIVLFSYIGLLIFITPFSSKAPRYLLVYSSIQQNPETLITYTFKLNDQEIETQKNILRRILNYEKKRFLKIIDCNSIGKSVESYEIVVAISVLAIKKDTQFSLLIKEFIKRIIYELKTSHMPDNIINEQDINPTSLNVTLNALWALIIIEGKEGHNWLVDEIKKQSVNEKRLIVLGSLTDILSWASYQPLINYSCSCPSTATKYFDFEWENRFRNYNKISQTDFTNESCTNLNHFRMFWHCISIQLTKCENSDDEILIQLYPVGFGASYPFERNWNDGQQRSDPK
ncbi:MAG: hypothetical protein LBG80_06780 [Bacteroidales bacterium]|jgi:hypothetical protein|nr:hypothetical protein [Bacteroidales bacterium]